MKLVVITGCAGFIGSYVTKACLKRGWQVYGVDNFTYAGSRQFIDKMKKKYDNFFFKEKDICDLKHIPDCDYVINIAAETHVGNSIVDSTNFIRSNIDGVKNLLDLIKVKPNNVQQPPIFFHFSTDEVYGDITEGEHVEEDLLNPSNPYSASKASADLLIKAWARTYGIKYVILRPTNNYGIRQYPEKLIPLSVKLLRRSKKIRLHNNGDPIRNWLHARDTANAVLAIIDSGKSDQIYNVAGGFEQTNLETVQKIIMAYYRDEPSQPLMWEDCVDFSYSRKGQDVRYALNDDKLRKLGWKPEINFDKQIERIVKFYKKTFTW
jgi:dTDP-glucose 4,6-dehydratase